MKSLFLSLVSGALLALSFPNSNLWLAAWFAFVPLFFVLQTRPKWKAFLFSYFAGIIFWSVTVYWLVHVTLPGTIILVLYLALYFGIFGLIFSTSYQRLATIDQLLFIPSAWVLLEYARSHLLTGFPWALLAYSQSSNLPVIQIADITGAWGVSFQVMMANVMIWKIIQRAASRKPQVASTTFSYLPFILCFLCVLGYGYYRLHLPLATSNSQPLKVSVVQGNIPQELKWDPQAKSYIADKYAALSERAAIDAPDLIIWPEASIPDIVGENDLILQEVLSLSQRLNAPLLAGAVTCDNESYYNSALLIGRGDILGQYNKLHLVPFGEYIPLRQILPFLQTVVPIGDVAAGKDYTIFQVASRKSQVARKFACLICFEDLFPELSREFVKRGADFLVNITNDAWYKKTSAPYQHFQASIFRAVENRVYLARSANTGVSGVIGPTGKAVLLVSDEHGRNIFVDGYGGAGLAIVRQKPPIYTRYGDVFIFLLSILFFYSIFRFVRKN